MNKIIKVLIFSFVLVFLFQGNAAYSAQVHRVQPGETLFELAQKYSVSVDEIVEKNKLVNPDTIFVKQVLIIPDLKVIPELSSIDNTKKNTYVVVPDDTLYKVSLKFGVSMDNLAAENNISQWDYLYIGQMLKIPDSHNSQTEQPNQPEQQLPESQPVQPKPQQQEPKPESSEPKYTLSQLVRMYSDVFYLGGSKGERKVALTFDDGPDAKYTHQVLDVLKKYGISGTFFLVGNKVEDHPDVVQRIFMEGHTIGSHSWSHPDLSKLDEGQVYTEVINTERAIENIIGKKPALIRPPYGAMSKGAIEQLIKLNYKIINWNVDSVDWRDRNVDQILINTLPDVRNGSILLFHTAGGEGQSLASTPEALAEIIYTLAVQGYEFVSVDELLSIPAYKNY
jgi:peptidoglycan/xylan/chitin deacetylase (PgdA/CDA1 family)